MTDLDKLVMLKAMTGETDEGMLSTYLILAGQKVIRRAYPFGESVGEVPEKYATLHVEVASYMVQKRGADGQTAHSENGVSRTYEDGDVPPSLMRNITPYTGSLGR